MDGVRAKKHLGQHFLRDKNVAGKIAGLLSDDGWDVLLEVGPGTGVLSRFLLSHLPNFHVAEVDRESISYLKENIPELGPNILEGDFLKLDLCNQFEGDLAVIGNFPYNISSQIVFKVLENRHCVTEMVGMFQKEVAERITAGPGSKIYGILSVLTAAFYDREYHFTVDARVFDPPPKVQSGVISMKRKSNFELDCDERLFFTVVKTAFNQRRKTLRNALKSLNLRPGSISDELLARRAEQIDVEDFILITKSLSES